MNKNVFCVIMAGGAGTRFWPLSREAKPKQFLDILGSGKTLLQQTFERFQKVCPTRNIYIISNAKYENIIKEQLPDINSEQVLLEPIKRNTAPCIAYSTYKIMKKQPDARIIVAPSDHLVKNEERFVQVIREGFQFIEENNNTLLTIGVQPSKPETGYGYIQTNEEFRRNLSDIGFLARVKTFTEKPNYEIARMFFESKEYFWNAGIFLWSAKSIIKAYEEYLPEINNLFKDGEAFYNTAGEGDYINKIYPVCKSISIDYGVMERADNVYVICSDFGWSDLGTWGSLYDNSEKDTKLNVINGKDVFAYNTMNCLVNIPDEKLLVVEGLNDYIVVEADNVLLICKKQNEQQIKQFVNDIKINKSKENPNSIDKFT